jgi:hypothetical protein
MNRKDDKFIIDEMDKAIDEVQEIIKKVMDKILSGVNKESMVNDLLLISSKLDMEKFNDNKWTNFKKYTVGEYVNVRLPNNFGWFYGVITARHYGDTFDCLLIAGPERFGQVVVDIPFIDIKR